MSPAYSFDQALEGVLLRLAANPTGRVKAGQVYEAANGTPRRGRVTGSRTADGVLLVDLVNVETDGPIVALPGRTGGLAGWVLVTS